MYFNDISFVFVIFGRVQYKQWDPSIAWFQFWGQQAVCEIESPLENDCNQSSTVASMVVPL